MNGAQHAVLWLGLSLIIIKLLTGGGWSDIWGTLKNGTSLSSGSGILGNSAANSQQEQHTVTGLPFTPAL
jgi:hypothetical protein